MICKNCNEYIEPEDGTVQIKAANGDIINICWDCAARELEETEETGEDLDFL